VVFSLSGLVVDSEFAGLAGAVVSLSVGSDVTAVSRDVRLSSRELSGSVWWAVDSLAIAELGLPEGTELSGESVV